MNNSNSGILNRKLVKYYILILGLLGLTASSPLYDYDTYNVQNEPEAIPLRHLRIPLQMIELPSNKVESSPWEDASSARGHKRSRHQEASSSGLPASCCPTIIDVIEPTHGKNRAGDLVELYQSETVRQRFYENSCAPAVAGQPCRFLDRRHTATSLCVQQYSNTYAMVKDPGNEAAEWKLDYIQVRSGCSCHVSSS